MGLSKVFLPVIISDDAVTRLGCLVEDLPKSLLTVCNLPLLWYQLTFLEESGFEHVLILVKRSALASIERYVAEIYEGSLRIEFQSQDSYLDTVPMLLRRYELEHQQFIVLSNDTIAEPTFLHFLLDAHIERDAAATVVLQERASGAPGLVAEARPGSDLAVFDPVQQILLLLESSDDHTDEPVELGLDMLDAFPAVRLARNVIDPHIYVFGIPAMEMLAQRPHIHSLRNEFLPFLLKSQYAPDSEGLAIGAASPFAQALAMTSSVPSARRVARVHLHMLDERVFCTRANTIPAYVEVNRQIATGKTYFKPVEEAMQRAFVAKTAQISTKFRLGEHCVIGHASRVGEHCSIKGTVVGKHCSIADRVKLAGCILMDHVTVEGDCVLVNTVVCSDAYVHRGVVLKDVIVGRKTIVEEGSRLEKTCVSARV